jgi:hypothetical protein
MRVWSTDYSITSRFSILALSITEETPVRLEKQILPRIVVYSTRATFLHFLVRGRRGCVFLVLRKREVGLEVVLSLWRVLRLRVVLILR